MLLANDNSNDVVNADDANDANDAKANDDQSRKKKRSRLDTSLDRVE
jgi:hypothetical protein